MENREKGYIYILTNPSFPQYVKIGYADNVENRLKQLNRSECIPYAFRVYAQYEVNSRLSDKRIHSIIDRLNPNLRTIETIHGVERKREFYAMTPEDAYDILLAIAEIHGCTDKLKLIKPTESQLKEEETAEEVEESYKEKEAPFNFSMVNIKPGEQLEFYHGLSANNGEKCTIINDKQVEYHGETYSLSSLATKLSNSKWNVAGPRFFKYKGEWLNDIRARNGK